MKEISRLHYITNNVPDTSHAELAEMACNAGVTWVQLRVKGLSFADWVKVAQSVKLVCDRFHATLIINDNPEVAKEVSAHGVHLGQKDRSPEEARRILGPEAIVGGTANTLTQSITLAKSSVNYIGLGPLRFTTTKQELSPVLGFDGVAAVLRGFNAAHCVTPIVIIGGVTTSDVSKLRALGAHGVAVSSAITEAEDKQSTVQEFLAT